MNTLLQDLRYTLRVLRGNPGFTAVATLALALGIGANSIVFSVLNAVVLRPLPYKDPDRLVAVSQDVKLRGGRTKLVLPSQFADWRDHVQSLGDISAVAPQTFQITGVEDPEEVQGGRVSANLFSLLGVEPALGRRFLAEEYNLGGAPVALLSNRLWQRRFAGSPAVLGRTLTLSGEKTTIVGIMPPGFQFPSDQSEVWIPLRLDAEQTSGNVRTRRIFPMQVYARLKPGVALGQAQAEMDGFARRSEEVAFAEDRGHAVHVLPIHEELVANIRPTLLVLAGAVGFILLIACANVANLLLARAAGRRKEIAVRAALGAGRGRILRQLLTESVLLAGLGGALGLLLAAWGLRALTTWLEGAVRIPRLGQVSVDLWVVGFTLVVSLLTGILFGLAPAWQASRCEVNEALKEGGARGGSTGRGTRLRGLLVVAEVALSLMLLVGAGLMIRTILRLQEIDMGFRPDHLLTVMVSRARPGTMPVAPPAEALQTLLERVEKIPGVKSAALATVLPLGGLRTAITFLAEGQPEPARPEDNLAGFSNVSPGYFSAMGIRLVKGRLFTAQDTQDSPKVAIINETLARRFFPNQDPIGQRLLGTSPSPEPVSIVGVVQDVKLRLLDDDGGPFFYFPYLQAGNRISANFLVVRTTVNPLARVGALRSELRALNRNEVIPEVSSMEQLIARSISQQRVLMLLLGLLAGVALALASAGIYGAVSYSVSQRTHEMGLRIALGAQRADVLRMVLGQALALAVIGVAAGLAGAFALTRLLSAQLYGVTPTDPMTFAGVAVVLAGVALLAGYVPARRATRVDPLVALRYE